MAIKYHSNIRLMDNNVLQIGTGGDLKLEHTGSHSNIYNTTGNLNFINYADDSDIVFQSDDGSGGVETYFFLDGSASSGNPITQFPDLSQLVFGDSQDLLLRHDGTDSLIQNNGGDFIISQHTNDKDLIFKCDDGSGGTTAYFTLDGSAGFTVVDKKIRHKDSVEAAFGSSDDMMIKHDGSDGFIQNYNGDLYIRNNADDKDIIFQSDDGNGGIATYFFLDGSQSTHDGSSTTALYTEWHDNSVISLGSSRDLRIYHSGTSTFISNYTGNFYIDQNLDDGDTIFRCDDGSGGLTEYFRLDGGAAAMVSSKSIYMADDKKFYAGGGGDLGIYHNGTNSIITNTTGDLYIENGADDKDILFRCDDGSGGLETYFYLDGSNNFSQSLKHIRFADNASVLVGSSSDLSITHDGTNSIIANSTGNLQINQNVDDGDLILQCDDGSGGTTAYITLDGSAGTVVLAKELDLNASANISGVLTLEGTTDQSLILKSTDDGPIYHSYYRGSDRHAYVGFGGSSDTFNIANEESAGSITLATASTTALTLDSSQNATFASAVTVTGNLTANGNIVGDDGTNITNIQRIEADAYAADADNTTVINLGASEITCLVADTDVFQITDTDYIYDPAVKVSIHKRKLAKTSNTDGDADGDIIYLGGTTSMTAGAIYHYKSDGTWEKADADAAANCDGLLAVALGAASDTNGMLVRGMVTIANDPGAVGDVLFLSTTAGQATATAPSGDGDIVRVIGYCLDASNGQIYFNPDGTFVEVTA